ncbi:MAG TPA: rhomboid family intramembrane serine protease, partial [Flavisolibacter sp.]
FLEGQINLKLLFAMYPIGEGFEPYQLATHMFTHGDMMHILFNMFGLWMFGKMLENVWGPKRFLLFYFICGVGAAVAHLAVQYFMGTGAPAVGASGAVMGILVAFAYLFPNTELFIMLIPIPVKAKWAVLGMVLYDLLGGVGQVTGDNIAHFAHLGGAATGFILVLIWNKSNRRGFY